MKQFKFITTLVLVLLMSAATIQAQFVGPAPLIVPGNNYAFAYSNNGLASGLTTYGLYFKAGTTTPGFEFRGAAGAKLVNVNSISTGNREAGDITFGNTGSLIVNPNRYAFRFSLTNSYGLFFNATGFAYEFRTADATPVFSVGANSGDIAFDGTATIGAVPQDNALTEVLVKDASGLVHYRDAATLGGGGGLWTASGSNVYRSSGNVGIGTTSPDAKLTIGTPGATWIDFGITSDSRIGVVDGPGSRKQAVMSIINGKAAFDGFDYVANSHIDVLISPNGGKVGIGTSWPDAKLTIGTPGATWVNFGITSDSRIGVVDGPGSRKQAIMSIINGKAAFDGFDYAANLPIDVLINPNGGNVGIGTQTPQSKLAVNGTITCKEVDVTLAGFPDYVFDKNYELMPLSKLSEFIETNGHLPNMPTEAEVIENGVGLGALNVKLVEKVEELTLHTIEQQSLITKQAQTLEEQNATINEVMNRLIELEGANK